MAEGVAEIEQRAGALSRARRRPTIAALAAAACQRPRGAARRRRRARSASAPFASSQAKKARIADQPVFHHLGIAGQHLAPRQGVERRGVGQHQARLVEGADQVLAVRRVDAGLAADRGIDLGQQGGRDLDEVDAAQRDRARRSRRDRRSRRRRAPSAWCARSMPSSSSCVEQALPARRSSWSASPAASTIAVAGDAGGAQRRARGRQMMPRDIRVGDDDDALLRSAAAAALRRPRRSARRRPGCRSCAGRARRGARSISRSVDHACRGCGAAPGCR